jgi:hypothetical protein
LVCALIRKVEVCKVFVAILFRIQTITMLLRVRCYDLLELSHTVTVSYFTVLMVIYFVRQFKFQGIRIGNNTQLLLGGTVVSAIRWFKLAN